MWSVERAAQRRLSWPVIEMLMHSFEDMICARFLEAADFQHPPPEPHRVVPHEAVTAAQSLRPYAGSLSHELRTPMQGIVGMLDVMHATVEEAVEGQADPAVRAVFDQLRQNIEIVQDSSRRAVEAADNVVHAYDMDMSIPEAPTLFPDDPSEFFAPYPASIDKDKRPDILVAGSNLPLARPNKRRRDDAFGSGSRNSSNTSATAAKAPRLSRTHSSCARCARDSDEVKTGFQEAEEVQRRSRDGATHADAPSTEDTDLAVSAMYASRIIAPGLRHTSLRELLQYVINEGLKVGGRPDTATAFETESGETVEVRTRGSDGSLGQKTITWNIDSSVPTTMFIDEKDLSKLISCVFLNALKFTDKYNGRILVDVTMSQRTRFISIRISDNGPGIPAAFLPRLFTPFSQQNGSITRSSEGLGLGLMVAKGIARKLGGDLKCVRAEIEGPHRGTEFEIKVPLHAGETISRSGSPFGSPLHTRSRPRNGDSTQGRPSSTAPNSPHVLSRALHEAVETATFHTKRAPRRDGSSPPPSPKTKAVRIKIPVDEDSSSSSASSPTTDGIPSVEIARTGPRVRKSVVNPQIDRNLAEKYPLTFLVAEDNKINRKLLVSMLSKFGYTRIYEAHDGAEAVRQMTIPRHGREKVDVVLMDLWMPFMDGYEATERILNMPHIRPEDTPTVLAVTADVTDGALERAAEVGMKGFMTKPFKLHDLQRLITEYCASHKTDDVLPATREN
jgi:signal transduction histidine kinase/AmiR/NasT family two-component response regulator